MHSVLSFRTQSTHYDTYSTVYYCIINHHHSCIYGTGRVVRVVVYRNNAQLSYRTALRRKLSLVASAGTGSVPVVYR